MAGKKHIVYRNIILENCVCLAILSAILVIVRRAKTVIKLELDFDGSNPYVKI